MMLVEWPNVQCRIRRREFGFTKVEIMLQKRQSARGFSLVELLVVIGIIAVLIGILIPVVGRVRTAARVADTQAFLGQLASAIDNYHGVFHSYPGPLSNDQIRNQTMPASEIDGSPTTPAEYVKLVSRTQISMAENLVLGLLGGLVRNGANVLYDPTLVGSGPSSLNPSEPKRYPPYIDPINLSWRVQPNGKKTGHYVDDASPGGATDSEIPEFVDRFVDPMPILYLRARVGAGRNTGPGQTPGTTNNDIIIDQQNSAVGQYNLNQISGYTRANIGIGRKKLTYVGRTDTPPHGLNIVNYNATMEQSAPSGLTYSYPYDAYPYFRNNALSGPQVSGVRNDVARNKDGYILISAGPDRIYGTEDDITNFGSVAQ